jgi:hypothetical protein
LRAGSLPEGPRPGIPIGGSPGLGERGLFRAHRAGSGEAGRAQMHYNLNNTREVHLKAEDHTQWVGAIVTNLQALETVLRYFLLKLNKQEVEFPNVGDREAAKTYLTSFLSLDNLIKSYNKALDEAEKQFRVDKTVVSIRDAFAHGRLLTSKELPARLWKFGSSKKKRVKIEFCEELTVEWLKGTSTMIDRERQKVVDCSLARGYQGLR